MYEKRPRMFAAEILALKTREERQLALEKVPEHLRELVRRHVINEFSKR